MYEATVKTPDGKVLQKTGTEEEVFMWANNIANENPGSFIDIWKRSDE